MANDPNETFEQERRVAAAAYAKDDAWKEASEQWLERAFRHKYMYNFSWLGRPIIQLPADIIAFQEIVWRVKPDLIIETGIAHGGSVILSASMLALLDYADAARDGTMLDPRNPRRRVLAVDIDIRAHNRARIEAHPLMPYITMLEGSSVSKEIVASVHSTADKYKTIMVCLDSNHTHDHVLAELRAYAPLVSPGSYCIVFDTIVEHLPGDMFPDRPWNIGDNPATATNAYLNELQKTPQKDSKGRALGFAPDAEFDDKMLLSAVPGGFLRRTV
jgi:cephalosporin hydroxylase